MFNKFLASVKALPPRGVDWAKHLGPVALYGMDCGFPKSSQRILEHFYKCPPDSDFYAELTFHDTAPIECPPETVAFLPVLNCGRMHHDNEVTNATRGEWFTSSTETAMELLEKGYIPVSVGGDGLATRSMVEGYRRLFPHEDVVLVHFSAKPQLTHPEDPIRVLLDNKAVKGVIDIGNRCVTSEERKVRKELKLFYMDMHAIYAKGIFCIRDFRNDYPVFLSINADVLDPAFAPGVEDPVPGGLSTRELLHMIAGIRGPRIAGIDIYGYNPALDVRRQDGLGLTEMALAKVLKEAIVKSYCISTVTAEEGMARVQMMQREGTMSPVPYPDH